jgi:hypothetical protein
MLPLPAIRVEKLPWAAVSVLATSVLGSVKEDTFRLDAVSTPALIVDAERLDIATAGNVREDTLRLDAVIIPALMVDAERLDIATAGNPREDTFRVEAVISPALMVDAVRVEKVEIDAATLDKLILEKVATLPLTLLVSKTAVSKRTLNGKDPLLRRPAQPVLAAGEVGWNPKSCIPDTARSSYCRPNTAVTDRYSRSSGKFGTCFEIFCFRYVSNLSGSLSKIIEPNAVLGRATPSFFMMIPPTGETVILETVMLAGLVMGLLADNQSGTLGLT